MVGPLRQWRGDEQRTGRNNAPVIDTTGCPRGLSIQEQLAWGSLVKHPMQNAVWPADDVLQQAVAFECDNEIEKIDEMREAKLAPPHPLPPAPTPKVVAHSWHTTATCSHRHTATHALPRTSTPSRLAARMAHCPEASGSGSNPPPRPPARYHVLSATRAALPAANLP